MSLYRTLLLVLAFVLPAHAVFAQELDPRTGQPAGSGEQVDVVVDPISGRVSTQTRPQQAAELDWRRIEMAQKVSRIGAPIAIAGFGAFVAGLVLLSTTNDCEFDGYTGQYESCENVAAASGLTALGALAFYGGSFTWASGAMIEANTLYKAGYLPRRGAGIAAFPVIYFFGPFGWIPVVVQRNQSRAALRGMALRPPTVTLLPMSGPNGTLGMKLGFTF